MLGPKVFILYIDDISFLSSAENLKMFAYCIENEMVELKKWFHKLFNKLSVNWSKTTFTVYINVGKNY